VEASRAADEFNGIHHHGHIKIISREMALGAIEDVRFDPTTAHMTQVKTTIPAATFAKFSCQGMPLQGLLSIQKLPAFVHMMLPRKRPFLQLLLQLLKLPEIQIRRSVCFRVHDAAGLPAE
jgi:hypothetical protein